MKRISIFSTYSVFKQYVYTYSLINACFSVHQSRTYTLHVSLYIREEPTQSTTSSVFIFTKSFLSNHDKFNRGWQAWHFILHNNFNIISDYLLLFKRLRKVNEYVSYSMKCGRIFLFNRRSFDATILRHSIELSRYTAESNWTQAENSIKKFDYFELNIPVVLDCHLTPVQFN